jgi:signal transduction histidine kinase
MSEIKKQNPYDFSYLKIIFALVLVAGIVLSFYVYREVKNNTYKELLRRTSTVAELLDEQSLSFLKGGPDDVSNPEYKALKYKLMKTVNVNPDARFVYLMGQKEDQVYFIADSESENSLDYSPPGQYYQEATLPLRGMFKGGQAFVEGVSADRWGSWLSALAPISDPVSGRVIAVVGMDIDANDYKKELAVYTSLPILVTLFILFLLVVYYLIRRRELRDLAQKAELISIASHEIRSPLNGLVWGAEDLLKKAGNKLPEPQKKILEMIKDSCQSLLSTVNDLLDVYAVDRARSQLKIEPVDVNELLATGISNLQLTAKEKGVILIFDAQVGAGLLALADKDKLKRVFNNLISNGVKYSKPKGTVRVLAEQNDSAVVVSVHDGGIGIPEADHEKVFAGFYRSPNARLLVSQGTGLGLYYVKQMVARLKGRVWFESKDGLGTTFFVELPRAR